MKKLVEDVLSESHSGIIEIDKLFTNSLGDEITVEDIYLDSNLHPPMIHIAYSFVTAAGKRGRSKTEFNNFMKMLNK